jgi:hypothetical protein
MQLGARRVDTDQIVRRGCGDRTQDASMQCYQLARILEGLASGKGFVVFRASRPSVTSIPFTRLRSVQKTNYIKVPSSPNLRLHRSQQLHASFWV